LQLRPSRTASGRNRLRIGATVNILKKKDRARWRSGTQTKGLTEQLRKCGGGVGPVWPLSSRTSTTLFELEMHRHRDSDAAEITASGLTTHRLEHLIVQCRAAIRRP
jgi:hypothetical protein